MIDPQTLVVRTPRTCLRLPAPEEAPRILAHHVENRAHFEPWDPPRPERYYSLEGTQERLAKAQADAAADSGFRFYVFDASGERVIGSSVLSVVVRGPLQSCFLGYGLAESEQGKGLMREAVAATLDFAWDELKLHRVEAGHAPNNVRSARLLQALGFSVEGTCRSYLFIANGWQDNVRNAIFNPRFPADWRLL